ncbi:MAG: penicillin-binding transpeptidase domain-containing protein [bacterium]|nr:penicillin-binding transpeptidase domain-containing protein [bacterium]
MGTHSKYKPQYDYLPNREYRFRFRFVVLLLFLLLMVGQARYFYWITFRTEEIRQLTSKQYESKVVLKAERGTIYDTQGYILAQNIRKVSIGIDKSVLKISVDSVITLLHKFVKNGTKKELYQKIKNSEDNYVPIAQSIIVKDYPEIDQLKFSGLVKDYAYTRTYPAITAAASAIGKVNIDNVGISGIERSLNNIMTGKDGIQYRLRVGGKSFTVMSDSGKLAPINGADVITTIHLPIQQIVDDELYKTCVETRAHAGYAIVMNPKNGHILAISSYPFFDPNKVEYDTLATKTRACYELYEPGSSMKTITFSLVLDKTNTSLEEIFPTFGGKIKIQNHIIEDVHAGGNLTVEQAFIKSSNIVTLQLANRLKKETFRDGLIQFGFTKPTYLGLSEQTGFMPSLNDWKEINHCTISYGHGISVQTLQLVSAYAAIANHGVRMKPMLIKQINWPNGKNEMIPPQIASTPISAATASVMLQLLEEVVLYGTGKAAKIEGLRVGGKTGTARRIVNGRYQQGQYVSNFIGIATIDYPEYVVGVVIDFPKGAYYGGAVAAPCWNRIVSRIYKEVPTQMVISEPVKYLGIPSKEQIIQKNRTASLFQTTNWWNGLQTKWFGNDLVKQNPIYHFNTTNQQRLANFTSKKKERNLVKVPYVVGLNLREAIARLSNDNLMWSLDGYGKVIDQHPKENTYVQPNTVINLILRPNNEH